MHSQEKVDCSNLPLSLVRGFKNQANLSKRDVCGIRQTRFRMANFQLEYEGSDARSEKRRKEEQKSK